MANQVKNVQVKLISIVSGKFKPKNGEEIIIKGQKTKFLKADKVDNIEGLLYVTVMKPNDIDEDEQYYDIETVKKAAHDFLKNNNTSAIDENHNLNEIYNVFVVESYVNEYNIWKAVIDISQNKDLMEKAKNKDLHGVSIYGVGEVLSKATLEDVQEEEERTNKMLQIEKITKQLRESIYRTLYYDNMTDDLQILGEIQLAIEQYNDQIENILKNNKTLSKTKNEVSEMKPEEIVSLVSETVKKCLDERDKINQESQLSKAKDQKINDLEEGLKKASETIEELKKAISDSKADPDPGSQPKDEISKGSEEGVYYH